MSSTEERWLPVVGYEGLYEVSDLGRVRSLRPPRGRPRVAKGGRTSRGYLAASLSDPRKRKATPRPVHHLVLEAFVGPCPRGWLCYHRDGDIANNRLDNLYWSQMDGRRTRKPQTGRSKLNAAEVFAIRADPRPDEEVAAEYGMAPRSIQRIRRRETWTHVGDPQALSRIPPKVT